MADIVEITDFFAPELDVYARLTGAQLRACPQGGLFIAVMVLWMAGNVLLASHAFDAYPFILLNLVLSCIASVQAPLIMMSQNRQEAKDRQRAENDYRVNLKNELIIDDLHRKLDRILENQQRIDQRLERLEQNNQRKEKEQHV